jgi:hypothetical protein
MRQQVNASSITQLIQVTLTNTRRFRPCSECSVCPRFVSCLFPFLIFDQSRFPPCQSSLVRPALKNCFFQFQAELSFRPHGRMEHGPFFLSFSAFRPLSACLARPQPGRARTARSRVYGSIRCIQMKEYLERSHKYKCYLTVHLNVKRPLLYRLK